MADQNDFTYQFPNRRILALRPPTRRPASQQPVLSPVVEDELDEDELEAMLQAEFDAQEAKAAGGPAPETEVPASPVRTTGSGLRLPGPGSRLRSVMTVGDGQYSPSTPHASGFRDVSMSGSDQASEAFATAPLMSPGSVWQPSKGNPFYSSAATFQTMAATIYDVLDEASVRTSHWVNSSISAAELLARAHEPGTEAVLPNLLQNLTWTAELLDHPERSPFPLLRLPDRFFSDVLPFAHGVAQSIGLLANLPGCELLLGQAVKEANDVLGALRRIQAERWEIGKAKEEEQRKAEAEGRDREGDVSMGDA